MIVPVAKKAIVTASDSGIGRASAVALARAGFDLGITWHSDEAGAAATAVAVRALGRRAEVRRLDLARLPEAADVIDALADSLGRLDALVNNAATSRDAPLLELSYADWRHTLSVNLDGAFLCAQRAARRMAAQGQGGRIVNITSVHEHTPLANAGAYVVSKHGLGGLTKSLAIELAPHRILVNSVAPGFIATPMTNLDGADVHAIEKKRIPLGRPGDPAEIAGLVAWLCSDAASYVTGRSFAADGGFLLANPQFPEPLDA